MVVVEVERRPAMVVVLESGRGEGEREREE